MHKEIKSRWIAALRNPEKTQTRYKLRDASGGQCCLDILNELACFEGIQSSPILDDVNYSYPDGSFFNYRTLTSATILWSGVSSQNPDVYWPKANYPVSLGELNDLHRLTLLQIADLIEADEDI